MHNRHEAEWSAALVRGGYAVPTLGLVSTSGAGEAWWLTGAESFAALAKSMEALASAALTGDGEVQPRRR